MAKRLGDFDSRSVGETKATSRGTERRGLTQSVAPGDRIGLDLPIRNGLRTHLALSVEHIAGRKPLPIVTPRCVEWATTVRRHRPTAAVMLRADLAVEPYFRYRIVQGQSAAAFAARFSCLDLPSPAASHLAIRGKRKSLD